MESRCSRGPRCPSRVYLLVPIKLEERGTRIPALEHEFRPDSNRARLRTRLHFEHTRLPAEEKRQSFKQIWFYSKRSTIIPLTEGETGEYLL